MSKQIWVGKAAEITSVQIDKNFFEVDGEEYTTTQVLKDYYTTRRINYPLTWFFLICTSLLTLGAIAVYNVYN